MANKGKGAGRKFFAKYKAKKTPCSHGHIHDSKKEAERCDKLYEMQAREEISDLECQREFELNPAQKEIVKRVGKKGQPLKDKVVLLERACVYKCDFCYKDADGNFIVEDCKGMRTKEYIIKRKLMLYIHHIKVKET